MFHRNIWKNRGGSGKELYVNSQFLWEISKFHCIVKEMSQFLFANPWTPLDKPTGSVSENGWKPSKICASLSPDSGRATRGTFLRLPEAHFSWNRLDFLDFQHADFGRIITKNFPVNSDDSRALEPA